MGRKAEMRQELDRRYVKQLDSGDGKGLRSLYAHYRDTCTEQGGSPAWSRATSVLVLELMDRLEEAQGIACKGFRVGDKVEVRDGVFSFASVEANAGERRGVVSTIQKPDDMGWEIGVTFSNAVYGSWELDFEAAELRKVESDA